MAKDTEKELSDKDGASAPGGENAPDPVATPRSARNVGAAVIAEDEPMPTDNVGVEDDLPPLPKGVEIPPVKKAQTTTQSIVPRTHPVVANSRAELAAERQKLQREINDKAKFFQKTYNPPKSPRDADMHTLVWIRAMKTHHPAPTVGQFSFGTHYHNFIEGMKYFVPKYVALSLEETENCVSLT